MRINDILAMTFQRVGARFRRDAILYALGAFCAVAALVFTASASVLALEPHVGTVYARLIPAGVFAFVVAIIVLALRLARRPAAARVMNLDAQAQPAQRPAQFAQLAMIVEAVLLGYSLSRRR